MLFDRVPDRNYIPRTGDIRIQFLIQPMMNPTKRTLLPQAFGIRNLCSNGVIVERIDILFRDKTEMNPITFGRDVSKCAALVSLNPPA